MENLYIKLLDATLEYGQGYNQMVGASKDEVTENYDFASKLNEDVLDYHIHKIIYTLNDSQNIQTLKMIYKSRIDGKLISLLDTIVSHKQDEKENEIEFEDNEEIKEVFFYLTKEERLGAISFKTNLGKIKQIGNQGKAEAIIDENLKDGQHIVFGFGVNAGPKFGVSSIYCYYMDKNKYGIILYGGLLHLRAKLKRNPEFKKKMLANRASLNEQQKLILDTCDLPDAAFFPIISYIMSQ